MARRGKGWVWNGEAREREGGRCAYTRRREWGVEGRATRGYARPAAAKRHDRHPFPADAGPKFAPANSAVGASEASSLYSYAAGIVLAKDLACARAVINPAGLDPAYAGKEGGVAGIRGKGSGWNGEAREGKRGRFAVGDWRG
jgi:hypothetical protein